MKAAADFLNRHSDLFDLALHGVGHEFWDKGRMERTEFHDAQGRMRPSRVVAAHLEAFWTLMEDNGIQARPGLFIPPALNHSFGNHTIQPLLKKFCINYVATRFSRARQYRQPRHPLITWESGVVILERGTSPVAWDHVGAVPAPPGCQPLLPLHWANLLHPCPEKNLEVVRPWADLVLDLSQGPERVLARDAADCWQQSAVCYLADLNTCAQGFLISLDQMPGIACLTGEFCVHLQGGRTQKWTCDNARITEVFEQPGKFQRLRLLPAPNSRSICLRPGAAPER